MPRKPKVEKQTITVHLDGVLYTLHLHPPAGKHKAWYVYWNGLVASKSTRHKDITEAAKVAEQMLRDWVSGGDGSPATPADLVMTDEEFEAVQKAHYGKKKDPAQQRRSVKTLKDCLEAIAAFKKVSGLVRVTAATPDDCSRFQQEALKLAKNWRHPHAREGCEETVKAKTVEKWSRQLMAAFERVNLNARRNKCVRGVVTAEKLLRSNPWSQFAWLVEGAGREVRQFDAEELLSLLGHAEGKWSAVPAGAAAFRTLLWSGLRREELACLSWDSARVRGDERHFEVVGKRGVKRWFRLPEPLYRELEAMRTGSPFVFAAFTEQLRQAHADRPTFLQNVRGDYLPLNFEQWLYRRVKEWAGASGRPNAYVHTFRKTGLQHAREGEDINREVAADARLSPSVLTKHYVTQSEDQLRAGSNRTYRRILASLPAEVARRYGHEEAASGLERQLQAAVEARNWDLARELSARLAQEGRAAAV